MSNSVILILGNQLQKYHPAFQETNTPILMIESDDLCRAHRYHKHKLILVLTAMRNYRDELKHEHKTIQYIEYKPHSSFIETLHNYCTQHHIEKLTLIRPHDIPTQRNLEKFTREHNITLEYVVNPNFITPISELTTYFKEHPHPLMENFYHQQRIRTHILMDDAHKPIGGQWNYDKENRKPLPKKLPIFPTLPTPKDNQNTKDIKALVDTYFPDNPGTTSTFWLPTTRAESLHHLNHFIQTKLAHFGPYEDAMTPSEPFLYHSVLSPLINIGLLNPKEVIDQIIKAYETNNLPLNSVEGIIRQLLGWREYMYGVYLHKYDKLKKANFFNFTKQIEDYWYTEEYLKADLPTPVKAVLNHTHLYGYNHHIERLMVLGNWFLLNEYDPHSVNEWFMSMYVDAYDWVMLPNVIGMSQYADGGYVATKPYISGGNYLQKMGHFWNTPKEAQESNYTKKYWHFLKKHYDKLKSNPRMSLVLKQAIIKL